MDNFFINKLGKPIPISNNFKNFLAKSESNSLALFKYQITLWASQLDYTHHRTVSPKLLDGWFYVFRKAGRAQGVALLRKRKIYEQFPRNILSTLYDFRIFPPVHIMILFSSLLRLLKNLKPRKVWLIQKLYRNFELKNREKKIENCEL